MIHAVAQNGQTCVVTFPDYGNSEEVLVSDVKPVPRQAWVRFLLKTAVHTEIIKKNHL